MKFINLILIILNAFNIQVLKMRIINFSAFVNLVRHLDTKLTYIPIVLLLGFFVTFVIDRWKQIFANISFIDNLGFFVSNYIVGSDEETILARKNILRYACASQILLLRDISHKVRKRFPTMETLIQSGKGIVIGNIQI